MSPSVRDSIRLAYQPSNDPWPATKSSDHGLKFGDDGGNSGGMEARVAKLENDLTTIQVTIGRIDERLVHIDRHIATKADVESVKSEIREVKGALTGKLGFWQFLGVIGLVMTLALAWPKISSLLGI